jgi:ferrochelatase
MCLTRPGSNQFTQNNPPKTGVLLVNLGTPDEPTPAAVRRYLAEFLWDPRVVEMPRWLWWPALHGIILRVRPGKVARAYKTVWTDAGSPLLAITRRQGECLQAELDTQSSVPADVAIAMRYGNPSIASALNEFRDKGMQRLLILPMYPQYSATTTASVYDAVSDELKTWRRVPELRLIQTYYNNANYIQALKVSVKQYWQQHGRADRLLMSFHGIPKRYIKAGDPYHFECLETGRLLAEALGLKKSDYAITFQSRFGRDEWLKPATDHTLVEWGKSGVKSVQVICPGFSADCLETLEEIDEQNRNLFLTAGGESFFYIPALNDSSDHVSALAKLVVQHMQGWQEKEAGSQGQVSARGV